MSYRVELSATAKKQLEKISRNDQKRLVRAMHQLGAEPRPTGCRKLRGHTDVYRVRVGSYRIIYSVAENVLTVIVLKVGHRSDVYR